MVEQNDPRAERRGKVEIMRGGDAKHALLQAQLAQRAEHSDLMRKIHESARLVQQQSLWFLSQYGRKQYPLPLAATQLVRIAVCEIGTIGKVHGDGVVADGVIGTYLHGVFEHASVASLLFGAHAVREDARQPYDALARWFAEYADMKLFEEQFL